MVFIGEIDNSGLESFYLPFRSLLLKSGDFNFRTLFKNSREYDLLSQFTLVLLNPKTLPVTITMIYRKNSSNLKKWSFSEAEIIS